MRVRVTARVLMIFSLALRARISSRSHGAAALCSTLAAQARYSSRRRTVACIRRIARPTIAQSRRAALPRANASAFTMAARCTLYRETQALRRAAAWIAVAARIEAASSRRHGRARAAAAIVVAAARCRAYTWAAVQGSRGERVGAREGP